MTDWSHIVGQHGPMVWRTAYRLLRNEADVADCFQRTFVSALELAPTEVVRNWPGLLKRLAISRALECLRQRRRESNRLTTLPEASVIDKKADVPLQVAEANELAAHLREALAGLDDRQAQVFCLVCLESFTYQQAAEQLSLTVSHVGVLLNRARSSLQERLKSHAPSPAPRPFGRETQP